MDEFVERIVANVLGAMPGQGDSIARPNYQREKARRRLVIGDVEPKPASGGVRVPPAAGSDSLPSLRRVALAATVPSPVPAAAGCRQAACGQRVEGGQAVPVVSVRTVDDPPRALSEVLGIRWRAGDTVAAASVERSRLVHLIAADAILARSGIAPEAMAFSVGAERTLLFRFAGEAARVAAALDEIRAVWEEGRSGPCHVALSPTPSPKLLVHLNIGRKSALGVLDDVDAAQAVSVVGEYVRAGGKADLRLLDRAVLVIADAETVRKGVEQMKSMFPAVGR